MPPKSKMFRGSVAGAGVVVDEVEVLPSDPPQRPTSVPQALQQNMPLASVSPCFASAPLLQLTATDRLLLRPCFVLCDAVHAVLWCAMLPMRTSPLMHAVLEVSSYVVCVTRHAGSYFMPSLKQ